MRRYDTSPPPAGLEQPPNEAFWNAGRTALNHQCKYVEGFCLIRETGVWIHHAWNVAPDGQAFDLTLPGWLSGIGYVGAEFSVLDVAGPCPAVCRVQDPGQQPERSLGARTCPGARPLGVPQAADLPGPMTALCPGCLREASPQIRREAMHHYP